jgi:hypothetical protein
MLLQKRENSDQELDVENEKEQVVEKQEEGHNEGNDVTKDEKAFQNCSCVEFRQFSGTKMILAAI